MTDSMDKSTSPAGGGALRIGVTGGPGSGKSLVRRILEERGAAGISADALAREAVAPGTPVYRGIIDRFGPEVVAPDGSLDRPALRTAILRDRSAKAALEELVHPWVVREMALRMDAAEGAGARVICAEVPLLFELDLADRFHLTVTVAAGPDRQIDRLMDRDGVDRQGAAALVAAQLPESEKIRRADRVIRNTGTPAELEAAVDRLLAEATGGRTVPEDSGKNLRKDP